MKMFKFILSDECIFYYPFEHLKKIDIGLGKNNGQKFGETIEIAELYFTENSLYFAMDPNDVITIEKFLISLIPSILEIKIDSQNKASMNLLLSRF